MSPRSASASLAAALVVMLAGCTVAASPGASGSTQPTPPPTGFYLRAWISEVQTTEADFGTMARLAIADGRLVDTAVAIPAIYPGPLLVEPLARDISAHGISTIVAELRAQGLLITKDFTVGQSPPGAGAAHLEIVVDSRTYSLAGDPTMVPRCGGTERCIPDPGTVGAFAVFWQKLTGDLSSWLGADLGPESRYDLERLSILLAHPIQTFAPEPGGGFERWPLAPFASFGIPYSTTRCGTVSGTDLATLLPILRRSNQLTTFGDGVGPGKRLVLRPLLPREPDACKNSPGAGWTPTPTPVMSSSSPTAAETPGASGGSGGGTGGTGGTGGLGLPSIVGLSCFGSGPSFQPSALSAPANAEAGTDGPAAALRALIATASLDTSWLPRAGWQRVAESTDQVLFLAAVRDSDPPYVYATVTRSSASYEWKAAGWGQCGIRAQLASPFAVATWALQAPTTPTTTTFTALVNELRCASGTLAAGRISDPLVVYGNATISVTFGVVPLEGVQTCPLGPPSPVVVRLREPLGSRHLVDGAVYPAEPVEVQGAPS